jgi:hypothetical protein
MRISCLNLVTFCMLAIFFVSASCHRKTNETLDTIPENKMFALDLLQKYDTLDHIKSDLNGDGKLDKIIIFNKRDGDMEAPRIMIIYFNNGVDDEIHAINFNAIGSMMCGGFYGDCYHGISTHKKSFTICYYGGSGENKWLHYVTFSYDTKTKCFVMTKIQVTGSKSLNTSPDDKRIDNIYTQKDFGHVTFEKYTSSWDYF